MKNLIRFVALIITGTQLSLAACPNPDSRFEYTLTPKQTNGPHDDIELSFTNSSGVTRTILDDDGMLTMTALYRSWQTNRTDIIPNLDINLLQKRVDKAIAYVEADTESDPSVLAALEELKRNVSSTTENIRFSTPEPLMQNALKNIYRPGRAYPITNSDGTTDTLSLCRDSGIRTVICSNPSNRGRMGECSPAYRDFCGPTQVSLPLEQRTPEERIKIAPQDCHPESLGAQVIRGGAPSGNTNRGSRAVQQ